VRPWGVLVSRARGVGQDQRVVIGVDDAAVRGDGLGDVVGVGGGQAGADVEELADPYITGQMADGAEQESSAGAGDVDDAWGTGTNLLTERLVDRVVVFAAQPVVPDPGRVRPAAFCSWCVWPCDPPSVMSSPHRGVLHVALLGVRRAEFPPVRWRFMIVSSARSGQMTTLVWTCAQGTDVNGRANQDTL